MRVVIYLFEMFEKQKQNESNRTKLAASQRVVVDGTFRENNLV